MLSLISMRYCQLQRSDFVPVNYRSVGRQTHSDVINCRFINSMVEIYLVLRKYPILEDKVQQSMQTICFNTR
jgi:hypothetical protein